MGILTTALDNLRDSTKDAWQQAKDLVHDIGTSALDKANEWSDIISGKVNDVVKPIVDNLNDPSTPAGAITDVIAGGLDPTDPRNQPSKPKGRPSSPSGYDDDGSGSGNSGAPSASQLDYLYADLSKHYKMDAPTAFQEALANTEYTRSVEDMKRAGLNPAAIFGGGSRGNGANANIHGNLLSSGGGSGGGSRRSRGSYYSSKGVFSPSAYGALSALGGVVGMSVTGNVGGYFAGSSIAQGAMSAISAFTDWIRGK